MFDDLYRRNADPWATASRWYEQRRRALLMAVLPRQRFASAYEPGCGNGNLSELLAARCDRLLASDASIEAVGLARARLASQAHVTVAQHALPDDWPDDGFDLVVLSELIYFLDDARIVELARRAERSVRTGGVLVACNWRADIAGFGHTGDAAHRLFEGTLRLPRAFEYGDADVVITGWSAGGSVAENEGVDGST